MDRRSIAFALSAAGRLAVVVAAACASPPPRAPAPVVVEQTIPQLEEALVRPPVPPPDDAVLEPSQIFVADPERAFPRRAILARAGALSFEAGGPVAVAATDALVDFVHEVVVVERSARGARLLLEGDSIRVAAYIAAADLREVPVETVDLRPDRGPAWRDGRVRLSPGASVLVGPERGDLRRVELSRGPVEASGLVPASAIGRVFTPVDRGPGHETNVVIEDETSILDAPGGVVIARATGAIAVRAHGDVRGGHRRVTIEDDRYAIDGWIAQGDQGPLDLMWGAEGGGTGEGVIPSDHRRIAAGTPLHAGPSGARIGVAVSDFWVPRACERQGIWCPLERSLFPWGDVTVWVNDAALVGPM